MTKLTDEERENAMADLQYRLEEAIEQTPRGINGDEIKVCINKALMYLGIP